MVCPSVRALASGLSPIQADLPRHNFYTTHISVDLAQYEIFRAEVLISEMGSINLNTRTEELYKSWASMDSLLYMRNLRIHFFATLFAEI